LVNIPLVGEKPFYLSQNVDFGLWQEVWDAIKENYIDRDKVLDSEIFYGSLRGLVAALGDPHSAFFDPKDTAEFSQELAGSFEGIGIEISIKKDQLVVVSPLPGTPAYNAGLMSEDKILAIDEKPTASMTLYEAVSLIRGPKGTKVKLLISRADWVEPKEFEITRDEIHIDSVRWSMKKDNIFYIEIVSFNNDTMDLFREAVGEVLRRNPKGIVLDLRGNPGGYLDEAIELASAWIEDGPIVIESYDNKQEPYEAEGKARLKDYPTIVLVNSGSASSSEIVAGALQDYGKATIVGGQTFGKGSVQELKMLSNGSSIKLTIARLLTPKGRQIDQVGITPDVKVDNTQEDHDNDRDPQLDKALELINSGQWLVVGNQSADSSEATESEVK
jgi:carboxyl-terminal processing protease